MSDTLRRLLRLVPLVHANPGMPLDAVAQALGTTKAQVTEDIDTLSLVGVPPFEPDDLLEITIEDDGVYVELAQELDRAVRLTSLEAAALAAAAKALAPGDAVLASATDRLTRLLAPGQRATFDLLVDRLAAPPPESDPLADTLRAAARDRREISFEYRAGADSAPHRRRVRPRTVALADGVAYLDAQKVDGEDRFYRLDRIADLVVHEETFAPLPETDVEGRLESAVRLATSRTLPRARVRFGPAAAAAAQARHTDGRPRSDGSYVANVAYSSVQWLVSHTLGWGGEAEILEPAEARAAQKRAVDDLCDAHTKYPQFEP